METCGTSPIRYRPREDTVSTLWDLTKFYECFVHSKLIAAARKYQFPEALLRVSLNLYRAPRFLSLMKQAAPPLWPTRGIVAGCSAATTFVKVYMIEEMDRLTTMHPSIEWDAYLDDIQLTSTANSRVAVERLIPALEDLNVTIEDCWGCSVAVAKSATIATKQVMAEKVVRAMGPVAGTGTEVIARNLGIDYAAGKPRRAWLSRSTRKGR